MSVVDLIAYVCRMAIEGFGGSSNEGLSEIISDLLLEVSLGNRVIKVFVCDNLVQVVVDTEHMLGLVETNVINIFWGYENGIYSSEGGQL